MNHDNSRATGVLQVGESLRTSPQQKRRRIAVAQWQSIYVVEGAPEATKKVAGSTPARDLNGVETETTEEDDD
jgi:hypothetical protein